MRNLKKLLTSSGEDLFHKNMRKFGATVKESYRAYEEIMKGESSEDEEDNSTPSKPSKPSWTGHADAEGLKAIGWTDEDIAYYQANGVNWNAEDDEYHKVTDDNKALYGVLTVDNISTYKDRIVYLPKIDTSNVTNMSDMFCDCRSLVSIPKLDTSNVTNMSGMFIYCNSLTTIPQLDTSNVTDMSEMFRSNYALTAVPLFDTSNVTNMHRMFNGCYTLKKIPKFDTSNVHDMSHMFNSCLPMVSIPQFDTSSTYNVDYMFYNCHALIATPQLDFKEVTSANHTFDNCYSLTNISIKNNNTWISFKGSSLLSKESLLYLINNDVSTSSNTISLEPYAYERLANDPDIIAALTNHPNISISK